MYTRMLTGLLILTLLLAAPAAAQDGKPVIALLSISEEFWPLLEGAVLDTLQGYGFINDAERAQLDEREDIAGEKLDIFWGSADLSLPNANILIENAIDRGADALITLSTSLTQVAVNLTSDLDEPPIVIFSAAAPYVRGIAQSACVKPAHVTGAHTVQDYESLLAATLLLDPALRSVGVLLLTGDAASESGAAQIAAIAESLGINVEYAAAAAVSDLALATDGLISRGVGAVIVPGSPMLVSGTGIIVETGLDAGVPVVSSTLPAIALGAPFGFGSYRQQQEGYDLGRVLVAWLNGEADIASTAIHAVTGFGIGLNLNSIQLADIEVPEELLARADAIVDGEMYQFAPNMALDAFQNMPIAESMILPLVRAANLPDVTIVGDRIQVPLSMLAESALDFAGGTAQINESADAAFVASLHCTPEMIAEQRAALDARED